MDNNNFGDPSSATVLNLYTEKKEYGITGIYRGNIYELAGAALDFSIKKVRLFKDDDYISDILYLIRKFDAVYLSKNETLYGSFEDKNIDTTISLLNIATTRDEVQLLLSDLSKFIKNNIPVKVDECDLIVKINTISNEIKIKDKIVSVKDIALQTLSSVIKNKRSYAGDITGEDIEFDIDSKKVPIEDAIESLAGDEALAIKTEEGEGKTTQVIGYINKKSKSDKNFSSTSITARKSVAMSHMSKHEFGTYYEDISEIKDEDKILKIKNIIGASNTLLNSLHEKRNKRIDFLAVDEYSDFSSIASSKIFGSGIHAKSSKLDRLSKITSSESTKAVVMDSNLSEFDIVEMEKLFNKKIVTYGTKRTKKLKIKHTIYSNANLRTIVNFVKTKQRTFIFTDESDDSVNIRIDAIKRKCPGVKILNINKSTYDELCNTEDLKIKLTSGEFGDYDLVFISPKVTSGVSWETEYFKQVVVILTCTVDIRSALQVMRRVRRVDLIHIYFARVSKIDKRDPVDIMLSDISSEYEKELTIDIINNINKLSESEFSDFSDNIGDIEDDVFIEFANGDIEIGINFENKEVRQSELREYKEEYANYINFKIQNAERRKAENANYANNMLHIFEIRGYEIERYGDESRSLIEKEAKADYRKDTVNMTLNAKRFNARQLPKLLKKRDSGELNRLDRCTLAATLLDIHFEDRTAELIEFDLTRDSKSGKAIDLVNNIGALFSTESKPKRINKIKSVLFTALADQLNINFKRPEEAVITAEDKKNFIEFIRTGKITHNGKQQPVLKYFKEVFDSSDFVIKQALEKNSTTRIINIFMNAIGIKFKFEGKIKGTSIDYYSIDLHNMKFISKYSWDIKKALSEEIETEEVDIKDFIGVTEEEMDKLENNDFKEIMYSLI